MKNGNLNIVDYKTFDLIFAEYKSKQSKTTLKNGSNPANQGSQGTFFNQ